jgi:hypothetical protein
MVVAGLYVSWNGLLLIPVATRLQGIFLGFACSSAQWIRNFLMWLRRRRIVDHLPFIRFGQNLGKVPRLACRDRYAMDHLIASVAKCFNRCGLS